MSGGALNAALDGRRILGLSFLFEPCFFSSSSFVFASFLQLYFLLCDLISGSLILLCTLSSATPDRLLRLSRIPVCYLA